jgi:hypothetical protein
VSVEDLAPSRLRTALVTIVLLLTLAAAAARPVAAGEVPTTSVPEGVEAPSIIPRPGSGAAPTDAGDRGGVLQTALFVIVVAGVVLIGALVVRESRRSRDRRGF